MNTAKEWDAYYRLKGVRRAYLTPQRVGFNSVMAKAVATYLNKLRVARHDTALQVLDAGCGMGNFLHELQLQVPPTPDANGVAVQYVGMDHSEKAIDLATEVTDDETLFMVDDLFRFSYRSMVGLAYDAITCFQVIEHLDEPAKIIEQLAAMLLPGRSLVITTPGPKNTRELPSKRQYSAEMLQALLKPLGCTKPIIEIVGGNYLLAQIMRPKE